MNAVFRDRRDAGRRLATKLLQYRDRRDVVVLGLPRGGVPVAYEVATALKAPLDVFMVRKLGVPNHQELAMGAIATGGVRVINYDVLSLLGISVGEVERVSKRELRMLKQRERMYRKGREAIVVRGRTVILVDDGLATGSTVRAAAKALRKSKPAWITVAVPIGAPDTCADLRSEVDVVVCAVTPEPFRAVGFWYQEFAQTSDAEVRQLLDVAASRAGRTAGNETARGVPSP